VGVAALSTVAWGESISLSGGASTSTAGSRTIEFVLVTGTDGSGSPSTYTASESGAGDVLTITDTGSSLTLGDFGVMIADIAVDAAGLTDISAGAKLYANRAASFAQGVFAYGGGSVTIGATGSVTTADGTLLYLSGASAFSRTAGGTYAAGILSVAERATVDFVAGDAVSGDVLVDTGATLDIRAPLATTGDLWVTNGAAVTRSTATVSAATLHVGGPSTVQTLAGDAFDAVSVTAGGQFSITAPLTLSTLSVSGDDGLGGVSTVTTGAAVTIADGGSVQVTGGGRLDVVAPLAVTPGGSAAISVTGAAADGTASVLHVASAVDGFSSINIASGATLDLDGGSVAATVLSFGGSSAFTRSGGNYTTGTLYLDDSAAVSYNSGDSIATGVALLSGATLDLRQNLLLSDSLTLGDNASMTRTNATIAAPSVTVAGLAALALGTGDSVGSLSLSGGGRVSSSTALVLDGSTPLTIEDAGSLLTLSAFDGLVSSTTTDVRYALRVYGDQQALLTSYLSDGRIVLGSSPQTPVVLYNPGLYGNATFIAYVVPEPSTLIFAIGSLATLPFIRRRRCRARVIS